MRRLAIVLLGAFSASGPAPWTGTGRIPPAAAGAVRVAWIAANERDVTACALVSASDWRCTAPEQPTAGLLVFVGDGRITYLTLGSDQTFTARWGRPVYVQRPDASSSDVRVTAWRPERSPARAGTRYFQAVVEPHVNVVPLSSEVVWLSWEAVDQDAFVQVDGEDVATERIAIADLEGADVAQPYFADVQRPRSIRGMVKSSHSGAADGADVQLFAPLGGAAADPRRLDVENWIRVGRVRAGDDGSFSFDSLRPSTYEVQARHPVEGRGHRRIESIADPVVVTLSDSGQVRGRVLRAGAPVSAVQVRVVPDLRLWQQASNPEASLAAPVLTDDEGRFRLPLPPSHAGTIHIVAPDGAALRLPLTSSAGDLELGDVTLPSAIPVTIRMLDAVGACELFAVGPLVGLGLSVVPGVARIGMFDLLMPEPGEWALSLVCEGRERGLMPPVVTVSPTAANLTFDVHQVR